MKTKKNKQRKKLTKEEKMKKSTREINTFLLFVDEIKTEKMEIKTWKELKREKSHYPS